MGRLRRLSALLGLLTLAGCDMLKPVKAVERPPEQYRAGPTQTGRTVELPGLTREQVLYLCNLAGTALPERSLAPGCYNPKTDQVVVMGEGLWPEGERQKLREHEFGHARGWRHGEGSLPPKGNIFAEPPMEKPSGNIFRGR